MGVAVRDKWTGFGAVLLRLCLLRFKYQFASKTFSVGEVMTDTGSLDSTAVYRYRWRNSRQQNKMGILKQDERENITLSIYKTLQLTGTLLSPLRACAIQHICLEVWRVGDHCAHSQNMNVCRGMKGETGWLLDLHHWRFLKCGQINPPEPALVLVLLRAGCWILEVSPNQHSVHYFSSFWTITDILKCENSFYTILSPSCRQFNN